MGLKPNEDDMHAILSEIDVAYNGQMEIQDYLQVDPLEEAKELIVCNVGRFGIEQSPGLRNSRCKSGFGAWDV